jgi:hypothetical protein
MRGRKAGRRGMAAVLKRSGVGLKAGLGFLAVVAVGGFAAGFNARDALIAAGLRASALGEMSASDNVSLRFPSDWAEGAPAETYAVASADPGFALFDPTPTYPLADANPAQAGAEPAAQLSMSSQPAAAGLAKAVVARRLSQRSNAVLNESQLAGIKRRLNLTREQERYWPAVAAELRKLEYKKSGQGTRTAGVDMSKVNVEGLKSAGFPLVMSFNDDQRQELKSLAHLLGLENVMSGL